LNDFIDFYEDDNDAQSISGTAPFIADAVASITVTAPPIAVAASPVVVAAPPIAIAAPAIADEHFNPDSFFAEKAAPSVAALPTSGGETARNDEVFDAEMLELWAETESFVRITLTNTEIHFGALKWNEEKADDAPRFKLVSSQFPDWPVFFETDEVEDGQLLDQSAIEQLNEEYDDYDVIDGTSRSSSPTP
jgi:hypothetical protein